MPNNRVKTLKAVQGKKTKVASGQVHPNSRRAKQLQRVELRSKKLEHDAKVRRVAEVHEMDRHLYFVHALPSDATSVSLPDLHQILNDYLNRHEAELVELKHEREARSWRKGEGKGKRETELEKLRGEEESEYKTGFGKSRQHCLWSKKRTAADYPVCTLSHGSVLPDLTLAENVVICRQWVKPAPAKEGKNTKGGDPSYLGRIRLIRIFKDEPSVVVVAQKGARETWQEGEGEQIRHRLVSNRTLLYLAWHYGLVKRLITTPSNCQSGRDAVSTQQKTAANAFEAYLGAVVESLADSGEGARAVHQFIALLLQPDVFPPLRDLIDELNRPPEIIEGDEKHKKHQLQTILGETMGAL
ncbi:hypothetical protein Rt10032_c19g6251 [Rhodotorula toruloides]|uniref:RNase III domain-containing protein n=1 Tax=Rhodotorula toruloides TaxID=5286 RepID=A0A511KRT4_RHOTO|nr:hypothetical protein Rt10032_c19g6251 [Rhodotorula toruloides]